MEIIKCGDCYAHYINGRLHTCDPLMKGLVDFRRRKLAKMKKVSDANLKVLINGLQAYKDNGIVDPWIMSDGTIIDPLEILLELKELRKYNHN